MACARPAPAHKTINLFLRRQEFAEPVLLPREGPFAVAQAALAVMSRFSERQSRNASVTRYLCRVCPQWLGGRGGIMWVLYVSSSRRKYDALGVKMETSNLKFLYHEVVPQVFYFGQYPSSSLHPCIPDGSTITRQRYLCNPLCSARGRLTATLYDRDARVRDFTIPATSTI